MVFPILLWLCFDANMQAKDQRDAMNAKTKRQNRSSVQRSKKEGRSCMPGVRKQKRPGRQDGPGAPVAKKQPTTKLPPGRPKAHRDDVQTVPHGIRSKQNDGKPVQLAPSKRPSRMRKTGPLVLRGRCVTLKGLYFQAVWPHGSKRMVVEKHGKPCDMVVRR